MKTFTELLEEKRAEMVVVGMEKGLGHPETIRISQELDQLLNTHAKQEGRGY
jgi:hypothetical protein